MQSGAFTHPGVGPVGLNRSSLTIVVGWMIGVPVPSTVQTVSHQYRVIRAFWVAIPVHQSPGFVRVTEVSWTHWSPENTSWLVWSALKGTFRVSKSNAPPGASEES